MDNNKDRFPLLRKILTAIGLPAEALDDILERILDWPRRRVHGVAVQMRDDFLSPAEVSFYQVLRILLLLIGSLSVGG